MMANIKIKNKKVLAVIIAFAMVLGLVAPATLIVLGAGGLPGTDNLSAGAAQSVEDFEPVDVNGFYTNKTVTPIGNDKYHIKLMANNGATNLVNQTPIDIALVLDTSEAMNKTLYTRKATNLLTHTTFTEVSLNNIKRDDLYDPDNSENKASILNWERTYTDNKYVQDPSDSSKYVYIAQSYSEDGTTVQRPERAEEDTPDGYRLLGASSPSILNQNQWTISGVSNINVYAYTFTDSTGHVWKSIKYYCSKINTVTFGTISTFGLTFFRDDWSSVADNSDKRVVLHSFYKRSDDTATSENLYKYSTEGGGLGLYLIDDEGRERDVHIRVETGASGARKDNERSNYIYYIDDEYGKYEFYSGNIVYGAQNGVFQGFRTYENGKVVHEQSIDSRTLYARTESDVNVSRMDALKEAVENFILRVHRDCVDKGAQVKVGVVTFGASPRIPYGINGVKDSSTKEVDVDLADENLTAAMIDNIYQFTAEGNAAEIDEGMDDANKLLINKAHKNYCVAFTDAVPTKTGELKRFFDSVTNGFDITIANNAIATSKEMKDRGVQIYTVGLFDDSDVNQLYGDAFYYRQGAAWGDDKYSCSGEVKSAWGRTNAASWTGREIDPINTAACNRMLNYMSNNFTVASSLGVKAMTKSDAPGTYLQKATMTSPQGFKITQNFKRNESKFYYPVTVTDADASSLYNAFDFLSKEMEAPSSVLRDQTKIFDTITDYFTLDKSSVDAYYQTGDSSGSEVGINWNGEFRDGIKTQVTDNSVTAWGVDFYEYYGDHARRLVLEFDVTRNPDFIGGNLVNTNGTNSGVYDGTDGKMLLVENFNVPLQNMDLRYNIESADQGVYYSYEANLEELIDTSKIDGTNNAFTTLVYTIYDGNTAVATYTINPGETVGTWNIDEKVDAEVLKLHPIITEDKTYHVVCKVTSNKDEIGNVRTLEPEPNTDATFYVFTPEITVADGTTSYGKTEDVSPVNIIWKSVTNPDAQEPLEAAPVLTYTIKTKDGQAVENPSEYYFTEETDFTVTDIQIPQSTFVYEVLESETVKDETGKDVTEWVYKPHEATRGGATLRADEGSVSFKHLAVGAEEATAADTGDYNWSLKRFNLVIGTEFAGDYANPEDVTYTVTDSNGNEVRTAAFSKDDFSGLKTDKTVTIENLAPNATYTVTKTVGGEKYIVTFTAKDANDAAVADADNDDANQVFAVNYNGDTETVNLFITNTFDEQYNPPVSGVDGSNLAHIIATIMFVLAGILGVGEVSYIAYLRVRN